MLKCTLNLQYFSNKIVVLGFQLRVHNYKCIYASMNPTILRLTINLGIHLQNIISFYPSTI